MLNTVALVGKLVDVPELRETEGGVKVANATVQIEQGFKNSLGAFESDYIVISFWRGLAEFLIDCAKPGSMIAIKGRLRSRTFECGDCKQVTSIEVVAERVSLLDKYFSKQY